MLHTSWFGPLPPAILIGLALCSAAAEPPAASGTAGPAPFFDRRGMPLEYAGPGREIPEPENVADVRIGYFGPDDPADPEAGDLWSAAALAIEQANQQGGYQGKPFRLVARWSEDPWSGGAADVTQLVYVDKVWAIIGGMDSASTHVAEQVTTKARLPLVCAASSDRTANSAIVPWMFSLLPGNQVQAPALVRELASRVGRQPFVVIAGEDHESRSFLGEVTRNLARQGLAPQFQFLYRPRDNNSRELVCRALDSQPSALVLVADAHGSARLVREARSAGFRGSIFGGPAMGRRRWLEEAGEAAENVIFPLLVQPGPAWAALDATFQERFHRSPDYAAAASYDAAQLLVAAIRRAGLNRVRIGDALRELSPWNGAAGTVRWDALGGNTRPVPLAAVRGGRCLPLEGLAVEPSGSGDE